MVRLDHPNVINYYDREVDAFKQSFYLGLGYCEGTLQDVIKANTKKFEELNHPSKHEIVKILNHDL